MAYKLDTLQDLLNRARSAFRRTLPGSDAWIFPNNIGPTAKVLAGLVFEATGFVAYVAKQIFVHTAPDIETLRQHGAEYGMPQKPAYPSSGNVKLTSTGDLSVSVGAVVTRTDGFRYIATAAVSRNGAGDLQVPAVAAADGAAGNALSGTPVTVVSGVTGDATGQVDGDITGGTDVEDIEDYRARILFRKRNPPHGGAPADYVLWGTDVIGVTRVFVEPRWNGSGTVRMFALMDKLYSNGIPTPDAVERVSYYLETVKPAAGVLTVAAPEALPVDITITGLVPNNIATQEAARASIRDAFRRLARVAGSATPHGSMPFLATPESFSRSWIWQAVAEASGEERHQITQPTEDVALTAGQMPVPGDINFADA